MDRPDAAVFLEMRGRLGMPVLGVEDGRAGRAGAVDLAIDERHDLLAALDVEAALGVGEIVLNVDDQQRGSRVIGSHRPADSRARNLSGPILHTP